MCVCLSQSFPKCDFLLDNEIQGSGFYLPELDEPEHCNAQNTALWELHTLQVHTHCRHTHRYAGAHMAPRVSECSCAVFVLFQRHYHPVVRRFAVHLSQGAPSEGSAALSVELSRRYTHITCV